MSSTQAKSMFDALEREKAGLEKRPAQMNQQLQEKDNSLKQMLAKAKTSAVSEFKKSDYV